MRKIISVILAMVVVLSTFTAVTFAADEAALGPNIATGKKVTAAGQYSAAFGVQNAVDGKINTTYSMTMTEVIGEKIDGYNKLVVDLGQLYELTNITVRSRRDYDQGRKGWVLEAASEADYSDKVIVGEKPTSGEFGSDLVVNFPTPMIARYILLYGISGLVEIGEVEAYGSPYTGKEIPNYKDIKEANYNAAKLVECLGIMQGVSTTEFGVNKLIRRDEAAKLVAVAAGLAAQEGAKSSFSDVLEDNEYIPYIEACLAAGLISKSDTYRPQDFVRGTEILKMLTYAMGYDSILPNLGEYPHNVLKLSRDLGITKGVEKISTDVASREDILRVVYNALITPTSVIDEFSENILSYKNGPSFLKAAFGLELKKGIVTENDLTDLIEAKNGTTNTVKIDGVQYFDETAALHDLIGHYVYFVSNDDKNIIGGWADTQRQIIDTIYSKDINFGESTDDYIVVELDEENEYEYAIRSQPYVLKNGIAYNDYTIDKLNVDSGKIILIDHSGDGIVDVIHIFEPKILIVSHAAAGLGNRVLVSGTNGETVVASDYKYLAIKNGTKKVDTTAIMAGDLVYAYVSENEKSYIFDINRNTVSGMLEEEASDGLIIDGEKYGYSSYYLNNKKNLPEVNLGLEATFTVDEHGDIVWVSDVATKSEADIYAVTLLFEPGSYTEGAEIKLFTEKSEFLTLKFAEKVRINGKTYTQSSLKEDIVPSDIMFKMAYYNTNANGEIARLTTEGNGSLTERTDVPGFKGKRTETGAFSGQKMILPILKDFPIFVVPTTDDRTEIRVGEEYNKYYSVTDSSKVFTSKGDGFTITEGSLKVYNKDEYDSPSLGLQLDVVTDVVEYDVIKSWSSTNALLVDTVTKAYDSTNGESTYVVRGYDIGAGVKTNLTLHANLKYVINTDRLQAAGEGSDTYTNVHLIEKSVFDNLVKPSDDPNTPNDKRDTYLSDISNLKRGDIIRYEKKDGVVATLERVYTKADYEGSETYKTVYTAGNDYSYINSTFRLSRGLLEEYKNNIMKVKIGEASEIIPGNVVAGDAFLVRKNSITKCTVAELPMYISDGAKMVIYTKAAKYTSIIVFMDE